ncbi:MAG: hypothetical protein E7552_03470 [Ruminococcaceae bacterium]|nr:hypothetical protein [Oscillospiraceae bacterium]
MKKILALLLAVVLVFGLAACNGGSANKPAGTPNASTATVKPTTPEEIEAAQAEIRYAIGLLLDRNYIVESVSQAGEKPASSFVADGMADLNGGNFAMNAGKGNGAGYYSVDKSAFEANFNEAVTILKKYYDFDGTKFVGFPSLTYIYNTNDAHKAIAEYIQGALSAVGITMTLENQEWNTFLNTRKNGDYSVARNGWVADYTDPICFLDMWVSGSGNNDVQFGKGAHADLAIYDLDLTSYGYETKVEDGTWAETYDVLISTIKACTDDAKRYEMMHLAEDMLMATGCLTPIYFYTDLYMISPKVEGFYSIPLGYKYFQNTTVDGKGDSLPVCLASEPDTIDPALNSAVDGATMLTHLFAGIAKWAKAEDGTLSVVADCATELPEGVKNDDGTVTYTYTLKDGLKWSDGKAMSAKDFEFAWKRAASAELGADYGYMFEVIKGYGTDNKDDLAVKAIDDKTLEVTLNNAVAYWNELLAFPTYFPVREDIVADEKWATEAATYVCNGAYTISAWEHDSVITMTKNDDYHDAASVTMNEIKFYLSDDANNMLTNYKNGDWLLIDDVPTNEIASLKKDYANEFVIAGQIGTYYVCWNVNESLFAK